MKKLNSLDWIALIVLIIGGLNWGLLGLIKMNLVESIFGISTIAKIVYILVGLSAVYVLFLVGKIGKKQEEQ